MLCSLLRRGYRILAVGDPVIMLMTKNIWVGLPPKYLFLSESSSKGGERLSKINFQCLLFNVVSAQSMTTPTLSTQSMVLLTPFLRRHNFHIVDDYAYAVFTQSDYYADIMSTQSHTTLASFPLTRNLKKIELFRFFYICFYLTKIIVLTLPTNNFLIYRWEIKHFCRTVLACPYGTRVEFILLN